MRFSFNILIQGFFPELCLLVCQLLIKLPLTFFLLFAVLSGFPALVLDLLGYFFLFGAQLLGAEQILVTGLILFQLVLHGVHHLFALGLGLGDKRPLPFPDRRRLTAL